MYAFEDRVFVRQLSFGSLVDLSEKNDLGPNGIRPRIAIVGAGITGVATACHILDAGFECHIFEAGSEESVGGIWTRVNDTSTLQIHSQFYKFHDSVSWQNDYPNRQEILGQVKKLWDFYGLAERTTFNCKVNNTFQEEDGKWVVNDSSNGYFDGLVAAVGTCGDVYAPKIAGQGFFDGQVIHSSQLKRETVEGKKVLIVGGGASAVEALEFSCDNGAASAKVLARVRQAVWPTLCNSLTTCTVREMVHSSSPYVQCLSGGYHRRQIWDPRTHPGVPPAADFLPRVLGDGTSLQLRKWHLLWHTDREQPRVPTHGKSNLNAQVENRC